MLTRSGLGAAITAVALGVFGWWWQYEELVVFACCIAAALIIALASARAGGALVIERRIPNGRVARGDAIHIVYRAQNRSRRSTVSGEITDQCDGFHTRVAVPALARLSRLDIPGAIGTRRRGIFPVGPAAFERMDPLGLAVGRRTVGSPGEVIVHPRVWPISAPHGNHQTVETESAIRRAVADPLSGFVSLRPYVDGDDPRMIHWPTTARVGTMMVREHVELRRPSFTVMLDTAQAAATPEEFEEMVDVAASVVVHALQHGVDVRVHTTNRAHPGSVVPLHDVTQVLDVLTPVAQSAPDDTLDGSAVLAGFTDVTQVIVITGPTGPVIAHRGIRSDVSSIVRIGADADPSGVAFVATDAQEFARRWQM
jgi:uncharacterized protein (DUF58 family)